MQQRSLLCIQLFRNKHTENIAKAIQVPHQPQLIKSATITSPHFLNIERDRVVPAMKLLICVFLFYFSVSNLICWFSWLVVA